MSTIDAIRVHDDWIPPEGELLGVDSNAGAIMSYVNQCLQEAGNSREVQDAYRMEAMSGDYNHLLQASMVYLGEI